MSPSSPDHVVLTDQQRHDLQRLTRAGRTEQRLVLRARIVLHGADGHSNTRIAADLGVCPDTVRKWRHRWCRNPTLASLADANRSGRPPRFTPVQVARVKALACTHPADHALPLSRWSCPDLARQAVAVGICPGISSSTVRRWLAQDPIKPWQF
jgi:transposase